MTPSNEHLAHDHIAQRLATAQAFRASRVATEEPRPQQAGSTRHRTLRMLDVSLHPTRKGTPA